MPEPSGLRERKKARTRQLIADTAADLFAERGFDEVSVGDVARAADVSDQTVYNYFPAKHDLVLDRAEAIQRRYVDVVGGRPADTSPAAALLPIAREDVERFRHTDVDRARGEFPTLCLTSASIRRHALAARDRQTAAVTAVLVGSCPGVDSLTLHAHAAALISVFQAVTDRIGAHVLARTSPGGAADELAGQVEAALGDLDRHFRSLIAAPEEHDHA